MYKTAFVIPRIFTRKCVFAFFKIFKENFVIEIVAYLSKIFFGNGYNDAVKSFKLSPSISIKYFVSSFAIPKLCAL